MTSDSRTQKAEEQSCFGIRTVWLATELRAIAAARPGCSRVEWMTDSDNPGARAFYKSLGFAEFDGKIVYRVASGTV
ncbi:GNAT family N-acetyltransferase [Streptomyces albogriseolus]|uniref:GNAT family N-acetyltransferase n=1 Tax=Streptomyces albogriseolus TaxID=1887 RepID=UPI003D72F27B